ncbi:hypothetical protein CCR96_22960 [Halochromatium roseum]|nr:hypothetical protein [Halochromatium roseum]
MSAPMTHPDFATILEPFGDGAEDFFLAASLYHAGKVSFGTAAALSGLGYEEFHYRLKEHFGYGFRIEDDTAREDLSLGFELGDSFNTLETGQHQSF